MRYLALSDSYSTPVKLRARRRHAAGHQQNRSDMVEKTSEIEESIMQLRLGFELDASVAHPKGEAVIDLGFSAANGQAVV